MTTESGPGLPARAVSDYGAHVGNRAEELINQTLDLTKIAANRCASVCRTLSS